MTSSSRGACCVKLEEEASVSTSISPSSRKKDNLFLLDSNQSDQLSFPEGCPVLYNFRRPHSAGTSNNVMDVRHGIVRSVSLNTDKRRFEYQIEGTMDSTTNNQPLLVDVAEDGIAYAIQCPVLVDSTSKDGAVDKSCKKLEGKVLFVKPTRDENGKLSMSYIVCTQENQLRMEEGVKADRLSYNRKSEHAVGQAKDNNEQGTAPPPVVVPNLTSNNSEGSSQKEVQLNDSERVKKTNDKRPINHKLPSKKEFSNKPMIDTPKKLPKKPRIDTAPTNNEQPETPPNHPLPQSDIYLQTSTDQNVSSPQFDGATSPLTCDLSESGDIPVQHKKINFQPPAPSRKRSSILPPSLHSKSYESCESPRKVLKTDFPPPPGPSSQKRSATSHAIPPTLQPKGRKLRDLRLTVPLWVLDSGNGLFLHIIGKADDGRRGYKTREIYAKTACKVIVSRYDKGKRTLMKITIKEDPECQHGGDNLRGNMEKAMNTVEESLLGYLQERGACNRLRFELRAGSLAHPLLPRAESGAVQTSHDRWIQLLEMPCIPEGCIIDSGRKVQVKTGLSNRIWDNTRCSVEAFADSPEMSLKSCKPYVLIQGRELKQVERATSIIINAHNYSSYYGREVPTQKPCWDGSKWAL